MAQKRTLTEGDIQVSKNTYPILGVEDIFTVEIPIKDKYVTLWRSEAEFIHKALTDLLAEESSNPPVDVV